MCSDTVIVAENIGKCYRIYNKPQDRLKAALIPRIQRMCGFLPRIYGEDFWALSGVSFEIKKGESVGIVGKNGSGKSTLLQMICGILPPTAGKLEAFGRIAALLELGAGFNPEFTGRENVYMNGMLYGLSRAQIDARFDAIAAFADIGRFIDQPVKEYSSGMFVRLAFAVIAHLDADILLIDEALSVGDAYFTQKCMRFLHNFMQQGTLLFVSHDMTSVRALAERSLWLENGRLMGNGPTKKIADAYLKALYAQGQEVDRKGISGGGQETGAAGTKEGAQGWQGIPVEEDFRLRQLAKQKLENRIDAFRFNPDSEGFGDGRASVIGVALLNERGEALSGLCGGERVRLEIRVKASEALEKPIVGFTLRNRLGLNIFGDNTLLCFQDQPLSCPAGAVLRGEFNFIMPFLPPGDYSLSAAIASGTYHEHIQHHWVMDACMLKSLSASSHVHADLFGMPMLSIALEIVDEGTDTPLAMEEN